MQVVVVMLKCFGWLLGLSDAVAKLFSNMVSMLFVILHVSKIIILLTYIFHVRTLM